MWLLNLVQLRENSRAVIRFKDDLQRRHIVSLVKRRYVENFKNRSKSAGGRIIVYEVGSNSSLVY
jgi:hypothetical protein